MTYSEIKEKFERFEDHNVLLHLRDDTQKVCNWRNHSRGNPNDSYLVKRKPFIEVLDVLTYRIEYYNIVEIDSIILYDLRLT